MHGSAALGGFVPASDLDVLVVTDGGFSWPALGAQLLAECGGPRTLELSVVAADAARRPSRPWPFVLHVNSEDERVDLDEGRGDPDLICHYAVTRAAGVAVSGPPPESAFGPVSRSARGLLPRGAAVVPDPRGSAVRGTQRVPCHGLCRQGSSPLQARWWPVVAPAVRRRGPRRSGVGCPGGGTLSWPFRTRGQILRRRSDSWALTLKRSESVRPRACRFQEYEPMPYRGVLSKGWLCSRPGRANIAAACISYSWFSVRWTSAQMGVLCCLRAHGPRHEQGIRHGPGNRQVVQRRKGFWFMAQDGGGRTFSFTPPPSSPTATSHWTIIRTSSSTSPRPGGPQAENVRVS